MKGLLGALPFGQSVRAVRFGLPLCLTLRVGERRKNEKRKGRRSP